MQQTIHESILDTIGNTPIVRLNRIGKGSGCELLVKVESFNPMSSVKDRIAKAMIETAERNGVLTSDKTIIEPTSGNTGIGLAMVAAAKGYDLVLVMPDTMSKERRRILRAFGANLILTPGSEGMKGAVKKAEAIIKQNPSDFFMPQQFKNTTNPEVHRQTTAKEIIKAVGNKLDYFIAGVGTGGTITGVGRELKNVIPTIKVVAIEPEMSPIISKKRAGSHKIQGIGAGFIPDILDLAVIDMVQTVSYHNATEMVRRLAREEGIFAGISAGAAVYRMEQIAMDAGPEHRLLAILPDSGERYLSTTIFD